MEKWCLLGPPGFEYLKMKKRVGKGNGREISAWLFASVTLTRMLAPGSPRPLQKHWHLAIRHVRGHSQSRKGSMGQSQLDWQDEEKMDGPPRMELVRANH